MKRKYSILIGTLVYFFIAGCASIRQADEESRDDRQVSDKQEVVLKNPQSLADFLMRLPGVFVDERTIPPTVTVRGGRPLFVVDNVPVGNTYTSASNVVNPLDIQSVQLLTSPSDTVIYGRRAAFGVILIRTKGTSASDTNKGK